MVKKRQRKIRKSSKMLRHIQPDAAGIDIGVAEIYVAIPDDHRAPEAVRCLVPLLKIVLKLRHGLSDVILSLSPWNLSTFTGFPIRL